MTFTVKVTYTNDKLEHGEPADCDQFEKELDGNEVSVKNLINQYNILGVWYGSTMIPPHRIWRVDLQRHGQ